MKPDSPILTIAIPTYNRAAKLQTQLERLVPQLGPAVRICVYDNASPDHTREVVAQYPQVAYFRAAINCGGGRNFFRCFEECQTEWVWILSDDDPVILTAVADLLAVLHRSSADFVHTSSWINSYSEDRVVSDLPSLFQHTNMWSLLWITGGVYRIGSFRPLFWLYNEAMSTCGAHLLMVFFLLESLRGKAHLTPVRLTVPGTLVGWSTLNFLSRFSQLPEYLAQPRQQRLVAERVFIEMFNDCMLVGLRETGEKTQIQKWQRIYAQAHKLLKSYQARGVMIHVLRNWYKPGRRKTSLRMARETIQLKLLSCCPAGLFHVVVPLLTLPKNIREEFYNRRHEYKPGR